MYAIQIARHGGPEVLSVREIPQPTPGVGEVLIRTVASSLNPVDWQTAHGKSGPNSPPPWGGIWPESSPPPTTPATALGTR